MHYKFNIKIQCMAPLKWVLDGDVNSSETMTGSVLLHCKCGLFGKELNVLQFSQPPVLAKAEDGAAGATC